MRVVQKFGGSSVADAASIKRVARRVVATQAEGAQVVVVISAMGDTTDELLDLAASSDCTFEGREAYDDGAFVGSFDTYSNCGGTTASTIVVAAFPPDSSYAVLVIVQVVTEADLVALDEVLRTFNVVA